MMILKYGGHSWPSNSLVEKTHVSIHLNAAGMPTTFARRMHVTGDLLAPVNSNNPQVDLSVIQLAMQQALSVPYLDLVFYSDDGTALASQLRNAGSLSGVKLIDGPSFEGDKATGEWAVRRQFSFTMEAEYVYPRRLTPLVSFVETISYAGGKPIRTMCRAVNRVAIDQVTWPFVEFTAIQSGSAVGLLDWPFGGPNRMPPYRFPAATLREEAKVDATGPERAGPTTYKNFGVKWSANFASALPLLAAPTLWT